MTDSRREPTRVLYLFSSEMSGEKLDVEAGRAPRERLYGLTELRDRGFAARLSDGRFQGAWGAVVQFFRRRGVKLIDPITAREIIRSDVVILKDEFSLMTTLFCRAIGKPLIYLDSTFGVPKRAWRRWSARGSILLADKVVTYSRTEADQWAGRLGVARDRFVIARYAIDLDFYKTARGTDAPSARPYVLALGRDLGRDYRSLVDAMTGLGFHLKIVTLPYLLDGVDAKQPWIEILQRISYEQLFALYSGAKAVVIPLKDDVSHPSGLRAMLEGMALGRPVIVTRTPILEEYASEGEVIFVPPRNTPALREAIRSAMTTSWDDLQPSVMRARQRVVAANGLDQFADALAEVLHDVVPRARNGP